MRKIALSLALVGLSAVVAFAADPKSGPKPGFSVPPFQVVDVNGPHKGEELCYRCNYGGTPVVAAFIKSSPAESAGLVEAVQRLVAEQKAKGLNAFVVFMAGPESKPEISKLAAEKKITVPMTFLPKGPKADDVAQYQINPEAKNTVLLWRGGTLKSAFANVTKEKWTSVSDAAAEMLK